jgi:hypothetical protein
MKAQRGASAYIIPLSVLAAGVFSFVPLFTGVSLARGYNVYATVVSGAAALVLLLMYAKRTENLFFLIATLSIVILFLYHIHELIGSIILEKANLEGILAINELDLNVSYVFTTVALAYILRGITVDSTGAKAALKFLHPVVYLSLAMGAVSVLFSIYNLFIVSLLIISAFGLLLGILAIIHHYSGHLDNTKSALFIWGCIGASLTDAVEMLLILSFGVRLNWQGVLLPIFSVFYVVRLFGLVKIASSTGEPKS